MPWVPTTDFEEEVVNLQPDHDFIYGALSEPQHSYPRPTAHTEYAVSKSKEKKKLYPSNRINGKLHAIQQVQRMANTKPLGEQPTVDDWDDDKKIEQETVGMMRYCGMGVSVEQPLNQEVTIATFPVKNTIKMVQNGRRKMALFFDENVFKLKEKKSDTSSDFESCNNSEANDYNNKPNELDGDINTEASGDTSFVSTFSVLEPNDRFSTTGENSDSFSSASDYQTFPSNRLKAQRMQQYDKLLEDTALLSLDSSNSSHKQKFETAEEISFWKPIYEDDDILKKQENWPALSCENGLNNKKNKRSNIKPPNIEHLLNETQNDLTTDNSSDTANSCNITKRKSFLDRFIKPENSDDLNTTTTSDSTASTTSKEPDTYATIAKAPKSSPKPKDKNNTSSDMIIDFQPFYTPRRMYALKRIPK